MGVIVVGHKANLLKLPNLGSEPKLITRESQGYTYGDTVVGPHTSFEYQVEAYVGLVCGEGVERAHWDSGRDDSPYAIVWNAEKGDTHNVWGYARIDIAGEAKVAYEAKRAADAAKAAAERAAYEAAQERRRQLAPAKGKVVVVARGRKVPKGTEGVVFWIGNNGYGESVGLLLADGSKVFTASKNCDAKLGADGKAIYSNALQTARPEAKPAPQGLRKGVAVTFKGSAGRVFWIGEAKNGSGLRVGIEFDMGGKEFVPAYAVEVVRAA